MYILAESNCRVFNAQIHIMYSFKSYFVCWMYKMCVNGHFVWIYILFFILTSCTSGSKRDKRRFYWMAVSTMRVKLNEWTLYALKIDMFLLNLKATLSPNCQLISVNQYVCLSVIQCMNAWGRGMTTWASCQIRKLAGPVRAPGMAGTFSPPPRVSDPYIHHGTCVTRVPWCMPGSLINGFLWSRRRRKTFLAFPAHAQPTILCIW